jgi:putative addiction module component (TIGR02574 family)
MSKAEILEELSRLTPAERHEILIKLTELDGDLWLDQDDPLSDEHKALIEARMDAHESNPETAIAWDEFKTRLSGRAGE